MITVGDDRPDRPDNPNSPGGPDEPDDPDHRDDHALIAAHRAGDTEAFGALFTRHRDRLWAVALRTTGDPEEAADALQDAMIAAYRGLDRFRGEAAVTTWLHRIVVNASLDRLRRRQVRLAEPLDETIEPVYDRSAPPASSPDPLAETLALERRAVVMAALDRLAPDQKIVLVLVDMEGYPLQEVARILDCPVGTVKSRAARGRARMVQLLTGTSAPGTTLESGASHQMTTPTWTEGGVPGE